MASPDEETQKLETQMFISRGALATSVALMLVGSAAAQTFQELAAQQLREFSSVAAPITSEATFEINVDYPTTLGPSPLYPWETIDFTQEPASYMNAVLEFILADEELVESDFDAAESDDWFHAPWLQREPVHGMTFERPSRAGELWPGQPDGIQNWAVSYYNARAAYTVGQVWQDPAEPNADAARFPVGSVGFKLLFTAATPEQVPYLSGSKVWQAFIDQESGQNTEMRLLQFDIAVRDSRADALTGWVFGTFMYYDASHSTEEFSWDNVIPVNLTWGNDPELLGFDYDQGSTPSQSWTNPVVVALFTDIVRTEANGFASPHLGLFGRANGPVDNPRSSCLACHGRAIDIGAARPRGYWQAVLPFAPPEGASDFSIQWFFRNLGPDEPFLHRAASLDYSLQLQVGIRRFRDWREELASVGAFVTYSATTPSPDALREYLDGLNRFEEFVPERGAELE